MSAAPPTAEDVAAAEGRIRPEAVVTPVLRHDKLDEIAGACVLVKAECLQTTGSFKIRGAMNALAQIPDGRRAAGVVAFSSGNHAQGVARAARRFAMPALIVMPSDAPLVKVEGVRTNGAEIRSYDRHSENREAIAEEIAAERGATLIPSFDDSAVIAGQGVTGLEFARQADASGGRLDHLVCCAGGGGLMAGVSLAFEALSPATRLWTAEPHGFDDHRRSFESGVRERADPDARSICDAILTPSPGEITFAVNKPRVSGGFAVSEDEVRAAMRFAFQYLKIVVEPGGAVALASVLRGAPEAMRGRRIGVVVSGGNVDPEFYASVLAGGG